MAAARVRRTRPRGGQAGPTFAPGRLGRLQVRRRAARNLRVAAVTVTSAALHLLPRASVLVGLCGQERGRDVGPSPYR